MMAVPSAAYSSAPESQPQKKPSASDSERSPLYVSPYMRKQPMKMDLSHSTLKIEEGSFDQSTSSTIGYGSLGELKPVATSLDELSENAQQFPVQVLFFLDSRRFKQCCFITRKRLWWILPFHSRSSPSVTCFSQKGSFVTFPPSQGGVSNSTASLWTMLLHCTLSLFRLALSSAPLQCTTATKLCSTRLLSTESTPPSCLP